MTRIRILAAIALGLVVAVVPTAAQTRLTPDMPDTPHTLNVIDWRGNNDLTSPLGPGTWNANLFRLDYRLEVPFGLHAQHLTSSQSSWDGFFSKVTSRTNTIWSAETYRWPLPTGTERGFFEESSYKWQFDSVSLRDPGFNSPGVRLGAEDTFQLTADFAANGLVAWSPSNPTLLAFQGSTIGALALQTSVSPGSSKGLEISALQGQECPKDYILAQPRYPVVHVIAWGLLGASIGSLYEGTGPVVGGAVAGGALGYFIGTRYRCVRKDDPGLLGAGDRAGPRSGFQMDGANGFQMGGAISNPRPTEGFNVSPIFPKRGIGFQVSTSW